MSQVSGGIGLQRGSDRVSGNADSCSFTPGMVFETETCKHLAIWQAGFVLMHNNTKQFYDICFSSICWLDGSRHARISVNIALSRNPDSEQTWTNTFSDNWTRPAMHLKERRAQKDLQRQHGSNTCFFAAQTKSNHQRRLSNFRHLTGKTGGKIGLSASHAGPNKGPPQTWGVLVSGSDILLEWQHEVAKGCQSRSTASLLKHTIARQEATGHTSNGCIFTLTSRGHMVFDRTIKGHEGRLTSISSPCTYQMKTIAQVHTFAGKHRPVNKSKKNSDGGLQHHGDWNSLSQESRSMPASHTKHLGTNVFPKSEKVQTWQGHLEAWTSRPGGKRTAPPHRWKVEVQRSWQVNGGMPTRLGKPV